MAFLDTFTEGSDTALASHSLDSGEGWTAYVGAMEVQASVGYVLADNASAGNRFRVDTALGARVIVEADVELQGGSFTFPGIMARATSASSGEMVEFLYDVGSGSWSLTEVDSTPAVAQTDSAADTAPSGIVTMRLVIDGTSAIGYADGVQKVSLTLGDALTGQYVGLTLGNFDGSTLVHPRCHEFRAWVPAQPAFDRRFTRYFPHLRM